jgi:N utilization substance protein B
MGLRRQGRELALAALYRVEITGDESGEAIELLWQNFDQPLDGRKFAADIVRGVLAERERIDALLAEAAENWKLSRLSRVDLSCLRIGTWELLRRDPGVPTSVVLDEAIEIARRYGGEQSAEFVNGLLDRVAATLGVRERTERSDERPRS